MTQPIALIGMGCRFPGGANSPEAFWRLLRAGVDAVGPIPPSRWDVAKYYDPDRNAPGKMYIREGGFLRDDEITDFDCGFFGIAPREAASLDPQQRLLLEVSWEALEHAGLGAAQVDGSRTGIYVGSFWDDYSAERFYLQSLRKMDAFTTISGVRSMAAGRIAHFLNINGPAMQLDTACSASLLAVHLACQALRQSECDMALAGGVSLILSPRLLIGNSRMNALAAGGRCRSFAAGTDGFGRGEGCGMVVLKRYADAERDGDPILARILGSAVNNDGRSLSLTTPNVAAQQAVLRAALANAGVEPDEVQYLEAHGTGTPLGDPIEMAAIGQVFGPKRETPLLVGSVKTNIAHLDPAAGVSGLLKVVLSMQHGEIPANLHFDRPNPFIRWDRLPVAIPTKLTAWPGERKLAGVSAFGLSGTNVHVVAEGPPRTAERPNATERPNASERPSHLLTLSAKSEQALHDLAERYAVYVQGAHSGDCPPLGDICYTAAAGRSHFHHRVALLAKSMDQLREQIAAVVDGRRAVGVIRLRRGQEAQKARIAFLFTGQGSQYVNMGKQLYDTHPLFRRIIDRCDELLRPYLDEPLRSVLYPGSPSDGAKLAQTIYAQPALFAIEYALAQVWRSWGIEPDVVIGHSTGEYPAACVAGVMGIEDGIKLVAERARLIESVSGSGATAAVLAGAEPVRELLAPYAGRVGIAGMNGPLETLIAGDAAAVDEAMAALAAGGIECRRLQIPHAPHSPQMDPILNEFEAIARQVTYRAPRCRFVSNVTGGVVDSIDAHYWRRHLREPVRFLDGMTQLVTEGCNVMLEAGPQPVLQLLGRQNWRGPKGAAWLSSMWSAQEDWAQLLQSAGELYVRGANLDWVRFEREAGSVGVRRKVTLPTYPFQRERQWTEAPDHLAQDADETYPPLLGKPVDSALLGQGELLFESSLSANDPPYLKDHRASERILLPAAAYLEMALSLGRRQWQTDELVVERVSFECAMILADDGAPRQVQCHATPSRTDLHWQVYSAADPAMDWTRHAEGSVRSAGPGRRIDAAPLSLLQQEVRETFDPVALYTRLEQVNLQYGPQFRSIRRLWRSKDRALGEIQLSAALAQDADRYMLHPALLDACLQVSAPLFLYEEKAANGDAVYLPTGLDRFTYHGRKGQKRLNEVWCAARLRTAEQGILTIDLDLYGKTGEPVGAIEGLQVRKVAAHALAGAGDWRGWLYRVAWQLQELPLQPAADRTGHWLAVTTGGGLVDECAGRLRPAGARVTIVNPANPAVEYRAILDSIPAVTGVLYGGDPDCGSLLHLIQALLDRGALPPLYLITRGAVACGPLQPLTGLEQSPLWGMAKVISLEYPDATCVSIDIDPGAATDEAASVLMAELSARRASRSAGAEDQVAYRGRLRYVARLARHTLVREEEGYRWEVGERGRLETLRPVPAARRKPAPGEIEIELCASGLNFRDVLTALDLYPGNAGPMGLEGAGIVVACGSPGGPLAVGDRVMAIAPGCFSRYLTLDARLAVRIPDGLSDADAATVPSVFVTAWHCLRHLAGIKKGDRVLIHTATGGIGHAAMQLARLAGAEIYATASPAKWPVLRAMGISHVYNSRSLGFGQAILADTAGRGVDIVLNTLTAPGFISESLAALADGGCFLEISKRDVLSPAEMAAARPDVRYCLVDQAEILVREPDLVQAQLRTLADLLAEGKLAPLPRTTLALHDMAAAFRTMEQAAHIGKLVLVHPKPRSVELEPSATYLITGGLGGLGLAVARGLVERGARRLLLVSRRAPSAEAERQLDEIRQLGATVLTAQADVADASRMAALLAAIPGEHPLKGVIHAAGLLADGPLVNQSPEQFARVMAPKIDGAWHLHQLTLTLPLDFFVLFSSASSLLGLAGQANYAAANAYLDSLAHHRQALGLPALAINWGVWAEVGSAAQFVPQLKRMGLDAIHPRQGAEIVGVLLHEADPQIAVVPINWTRFDTRRAFLSGFRRKSAPAELLEAPDSLLPDLEGKSGDERKALLAAYVQAQVASILRYASPSSVPMRQGFRELGLDSLTSMELRNRIQNSLECQLPAAVIFNNPTVEALVAYLLNNLSTAAPEPDSAPEPAPDSSSAAMRERIVTVRGLELCVCEWGPENGKLVVCVHGTRDHGASWEGVAAALVDEGYRVVAPDLRGHGRSGHGASSSQYHLRDFAGDLAQIVQELGSQPIVLMGHSLGSIIAVLYANAHPRRVERLILVEPPLSPMAEDAQSFAQQMAANLRAADELRQHAIMPDLDSAAERLRHLTPALPIETALRRARRLTRPQGDGVVWRWDARFDGQTQLDALFAGLHRTEFLAMLAGIEAPLTVVYGDASGWISPAEKAQIQSVCPHLRPVVLAGGHNVHLDAPAALARAVGQAPEIPQEAAACQ